MQAFAEKELFRSHLLPHHRPRGGGAGTSPTGQGGDFDVRPFHISITTGVTPVFAKEETALALPGASLLVSGRQSPYLTSGQFRSS